MERLSCFGERGSAKTYTARSGPPLPIFGWQGLSPQDPESADLLNVRARLFALAVVYRHNCGETSEQSDP